MNTIVESCRAPNTARKPHRYGDSERIGKIQHEFRTKMFSAGFCLLVDYFADCHDLGVPFDARIRPARPLPSRRIAQRQRQSFRQVDTRPLTFARAHILCAYSGVHRYPVAPKHSAREREIENTNGDMLADTKAATGL